MSERDPGVVRYAVDRVTGRGRRARIVLQDDAGTVVELAPGLLPFAVRDGVVLSVPTRGGEAQWADAVRDVAEEQRRIEWAARTLRELKRRDPGGDIAL